MSTFHLQAYKYEENYPQALAGFSRASQLAPSWPEPQTHESHLLTFLSNVRDLTQAKVRRALSHLTRQCLLSSQGKQNDHYIHGYFSNHLNSTAKIVVSKTKKN